MPTATVRVSNLSSRTTKQDIVNFFSFSGEIQRLDLQRQGDGSLVAYVTFRDYEALDTALLLSGAKMANHSVTIVPVEVHVTSQETDERLEVVSGAGNTHTEDKAKATIANVLAKGILLGKDAIDAAKSFDQKHQLSAQAAASVSSLDEKVRISEKVNAGTSTLNQGLKAIDEKFQVSEKTKLALSAAEQTLQSAGSVLMNNQYIYTGATWLTGALSTVSKVINDVSQKTKERVQTTEMQRREKANNGSFGSATHLDLFPDHSGEDETGENHSIQNIAPASLRTEVQY